MTFREIRNAIIENLWNHLDCPVVLSDQVQPEAEPPFCVYTVTTPYIPTGGMGDYSVAGLGDGTAAETRMEMPSATFSFTFCSWNRTGPDGEPVSGEDEAEDLAEKAAAYFLHTGYDDFMKLGVAVAEVGQVQSRTFLVIDEAARRYGFDVRVRYTRRDTRVISTVETVPILDKGVKRK